MLRSPPGTHGVWKKSLSGHVERQTNNKNAHIIVLLSTRAPAFISGPIRSVAGQRVGLLYKRQIKTLKSLFNPILWKFLRYKQRVPLYLWAGANEYGFFFFSLLPRRKHSALMNGNRVLAQLRRFGTKLTLKMVCSAKMQRERERRERKNKYLSSLARTETDLHQFLRFYAIFRQIVQFLLVCPFKRRYFPLKRNFSTKINPMVKYT